MKEKVKDKVFYVWTGFLDKIGLTDPWVQIAVTGLLKTIAIFGIPFLVIGLLLGKIL